MRYVVTFDSRPVKGPGALLGLRRTGLQYARGTIALAARYGRIGRIFDAETLLEIK